MRKFAMFAAVLSTETLLAHGSTEHDFSHTGFPWNWSPLILASLFFLGLGYRMAWRRLRREKTSATNRYYSWQPLAFVSGLGILFVALISPLSEAAEVYASLHMVQHMLIMMVAAPLFILGMPSLVMPWAAPGPWRRRLWRARRAVLRRHLSGHWLSQPIIVTFVYGLVLWVWHLPALYEAALRQPLLHDGQHICFFVVSCLFWRSLYDPFGRGLNLFAGIIYLFVASLHSMALGVFMTLSPRVWYGFYDSVAAERGIDALADQRTAGLIMWMPVGMIYVGAAVVLLLYWLDKPQKAYHPHP